MDAHRGVIITRILPRSTPPAAHASANPCHECPDEPGKLARDRDHGDARITGRDQTPIAGVEPDLGVVAVGHDLVGLPLVPTREADTDVRPVSVGSRGLDQHPPDVTVAGLGDRPAVLTGPARVL